MKRKYHYLITTIIGILFFIAIISMKNIFEKNTSTEIFHVLTDATFVPGLVLFGFGLLVLAYNAGTFDMLAYGMRMLFGKFFRNISDRKYKTFYDYKTAVHEEKKQCGYLIIVGLAFLGLSLIFLMIYFQTLK